MKKKFVGAVFAATIAVLCPLRSADAITYNLDLVVGAGGAAGTIDTDGTLGVLSSSNTTGYSVTLNDGSSSA